jgi:hypothetical protein
MQSLKDDKGDKKGAKKEGAEEEEVPGGTAKVEGGSNPKRS